MRYPLLTSLLLAVCAYGQPPDPGPLAPGTPTLNWHSRTDIYVHKFVSWQSAFDTLPGVMFNYAVDSPEEWSQTPTGFFKRLGSSYGQYVSRETIELAMFGLHKEDPRYRPRGSGVGTKSRLGAVLRSTVMAGDLHGGETVAIGSLVGIAGSRALAVSWLPESQRNATDVLISTGLGILTKAAGNGVREFWPDVRRKLLHRKH